MFSGGEHVLPGVLELTKVVVIGSLVVVMRGCVVMCRSLTVMLYDGASDLK